MHHIVSEYEQLKQETFKLNMVITNLEEQDIGKMRRSIQQFNEEQLRFKKK
jgi:hypothetical protein